MKTSSRLLLTSALLLPMSLFAASFEGKVTMKMTSGREKPQEIKYAIKGDKVRMEFPGQQGSGAMILDTKKREMTMLMDEQKAYMVMAPPQAAMDAMAKKNEDMQLEKTGETDKILGYTATKYLLTDRNSETELWLAEGLGSFMGFSNPNPMGRGRSAAPPAWERALEGKDLFPLRVVTREGSARNSKGKSADKAKSKGKGSAGGESFRMEVTAIDKSAQPDSLFNPPADYQKFDMGGMMKGMIPGAR